jgi:hypothetical protein
MRTSLLTAAIAALTATSLSAQGALSAPCFVSQLGTNLGLGDDQVAPNNALGFTFPGPAGAVTSIDISSNGFVWLASNPFDSGCCNGFATAFVTGLPRIALMWGDLDPSTAGNVWFNTIPASGSQPASAVVTWDGVPEFGDSTPMTMQLQLFADGSFSMLFGNDVYNLQHQVLTGVTQGGTATQNAVDFSTISASTPYVSGTNPTIHEEQQMVMDLQGKILVFLPNGSGGYIVLDRPPCVLASAVPYGVGCPKPATAYEWFQQPAVIDLSNIAIEFTPTAAGGFVAVPTTGFFTGYSNSSVYQDDQVLGPFNLGFTFNFPGGSTSAINIASNGFIWLGTGNFDPRCCDPDPTWFITDPASIAAVWMDLYPPGGGNVYFDTTPGEAHVTWLNVPEYFQGGPQTAQITLRANGSFRLAYQTVNNTMHSPIVGFTEGNAAIDPGASDFSAGPVIIGSGGTPMLLRSQLGSRPAIGSSYTMEVDQVAAGSLLGIMVLGLTQFLPGVDLTAIGMPGCELFTSLDALSTFPLAGPPAPFVFAIPNSTTQLDEPRWLRAARAGRHADAGRQRARHQRLERPAHHGRLLIAPAAATRR